MNGTLDYILEFFFLYSWYWHFEIWAARSIAHLSCVIFIDCFSMSTFILYLLLTFRNDAAFHRWWLFMVVTKSKLIFFFSFCLMTCSAMVLNTFPVRDMTTNKAKVVAKSRQILYIAVHHVKKVSIKWKTKDITDLQLEISLKYSPDIISMQCLCPFTLSVELELTVRHER